ncbi:MAG: Uma2 family endonuclease, partial [Chloroherpetonaceae bacterium]|nr:Uma2 family endonuclease [Chloroherpetonaceae bacterium]
MATKSARPKRRTQLKPLYDGKKMSLEKFWDFKAEDGFKYEWINGVLLASEYMMKTSELLTVVRIQEAFRHTTAAREGGALLAETKVFLKALNRARIPDLAYFTKEELLRSEQGEETIPKFVIEFISPTDRFKYYDDKLNEYFASGVQTVWLLDREKKRVWVFTSPKEVKICTDDDICSAAPAIPDFQISV